MKRRLTWISVFSALAFWAGPAPAAAQPRRVLSLDGAWELAEGAMQKRPDAFPHSIRVPGVLNQAQPPIPSVQPREGEGMFGKTAPRRGGDRNAFWYRRTIQLDGAMPAVALLRVNKARWGVKAWVNGAEVGEHPRVRTAAVFDVRQFLRGGGARNEIILRIGATQHEVPAEIPAFSAWTGNLPGVYDSVSLVLCDTPHVVRVQAVPDLKASVAILAVTLRNRARSPTTAQVTARVLDDRSGTVVATIGGRSVLQPESETTLDLVAAIPNAAWWSPSSPHLYRVEIEVRDPVRITDLFSDRFGMRSFAILPETGRGLLNGAPVLLRGAGVLNVVDLFEHPDCGDKPWNERWVRQALRNIKAVNGNAARFAFDHPPELWYRIADEEGVMIQDEAHSRIGDRVTVDALAVEFAEWIHERANHPSVVIWDASNETPAAEAKGRLLAAIAQVRHLDRSNRPWDNSWDPTGQPGDVTFELHPYLGWRPNYSQTLFREEATKADWPGNHQDVATASLKPGFVINEYCGVMLMADGSSSQLARKFFETFMPSNATAADRFLARARFTAMETEYWRRVPGVLGVLWNPYLHGSGRHVIDDLGKTVH